MGQFIGQCNCFLLILPFRIYQKIGTVWLNINKIIKFRKFELDLNIKNIHTHLLKILHFSFL